MNLMSRARLILVLSLGLVPVGVVWGQNSALTDLDAVDLKDARDQEFHGLLDPTRAGDAIPIIQFLNNEGQETSLQDYAGQALVVNFWATWCAPCIAEMPALDSLNQEILASGGRVIAINTDFDPEAGPAWLAENKINSLEFFYDSTGNAYFDAGGTGLPYTLVIDPQGIITAEVLGDAPWDTPAAAKMIMGLIGKDSL